MAYYFRVWVYPLPIVDSRTLGRLLKLWDNREGYIWIELYLYTVVDQIPPCQPFYFRHNSRAQAILQSTAASESIRWRFRKQLGSWLEGFDQLGLWIKWITRALCDHYCQGDLQSQFSARKGHTEVYWLTDQPFTVLNHLNMAATDRVWQRSNLISTFS